MAGKGKGNFKNTGGSLSPQTDPKGKPPSLTEDQVGKSLKPRT